MNESEKNYFGLLGKKYLLCFKAALPAGSDTKIFISIQIAKSQLLLKILANDPDPQTKTKDCSIVDTKIECSL